MFEGSQASLFVLLTIVRSIQIKVKYEALVEWYDRVKPKFSPKNLSQYHYVHHE